MIRISPEDVEFLVFFEEEIEAIETQLSADQTEPNLRILAARLRSSLHRTEGHLLRAHQIFGFDPILSIQNDQVFFYSQVFDSPAVKTVEFRKSISTSELEDFTGKKCPDGTYAMAVPILGFNPMKPPRLSAEKPKLGEFLDRPIVGIERSPVSRWQIVSYLANKKGIAHYSDTREKAWQALLDRYWNTTITSRKGDVENSIRAPFEILQRIAVEMLNAPNLPQIRARTQQLAKLAR